MPSVPSWVKYDKDQMRIHCSPEAVECEFEKRIGPLIQQDYLDEIHNMLDDILTSINYNLFHSSEQDSFLCGVINVAYTVQMDKVYLQNVMVRPCAEGLGLFKMILYFFIHVCAMRGVSLAVNAESERVKAVLRGISPSFQIRDIQVEDTKVHAWVLRPVFSRSIKPSQCGVTGKFYYNDRELCYTINKEFFPSNSDLNDAEMMEARRPFRAVKAKSFWRLICCCFY